MRESQASQDVFSAAARGDTKAVMAALVAHGDPNCCNADGLTCLMMAVAGGHLGVVRLLVSSDASVNAAPCSWGLSPLGLAAAQGSLENARLLLQWKADANVSRSTGYAPLSRAAAAGHAALCRLLLEHAAEVDACDGQGVTAAMRAVEHGHLELARLFVTAGASMARADRTSCSTLTRTVDLLLRAEAHGQPFLDGLRSPLSEPDLWTELCGAMVERRADIDIVDAQGNTLLCRAVKHRRREVVSALLRMKADPDTPMPSLNGGTALLQTVTEGRVDLCQALILRSASVNLPSASGVTPLCLAIDKVDEEMCFYLIQSGAQFRTRDPATGEPLLMRAAAKGLCRLYQHLQPHAAVEAVQPEAREAGREVAPHGRAAAALDYG